MRKPTTAANPTTLQNKATNAVVDKINETILTPSATKDAPFVHRLIP